MSTHDAVVERILRASRDAGRDEVAGIAYRMARTCLSFASNSDAHHFRWFEVVESIATLRKDLSRVEVRTRSEHERQELPLINPSAAEAAGAGLACLDLAAEVEGDSARVAYLRAMLALPGGSVEGVESELRHLLLRPLDLNWYRTVQEARQALLIELEEHSEASSVGLELRSLGYAGPATAYNVLMAAAGMQETGRFEQIAEWLRESLNGENDLTFWAHLIGTEAPWIAGRFGREPTDVIRILPGGEFAEEPER